MNNIVTINEKEYISSVVFAPIMSAKKIINIIQNIVIDNQELRNNKPINPLSINLIYDAGKPTSKIYIGNNVYNFHIQGFREHNFGFEHIWVKETIKI